MDDQTIEPTRQERALAKLAEVQASEHWKVIKPLWEASQFARIMSRAQWLTENGRAAATDCLNTNVRHLGDLLMATGVAASYGDAQITTDLIVNTIDGE